jgi:hypothetical protein
MGTSSEEHYTFFIISRSFLPRMGNVSDKSWIENQNTQFVYRNVFFLNRAVCEIMLKNIAQRDRPQITWRMRIACWIPKAANTHTQVVLCSLLFHCYNGCTNAPQCYVIRILPGLFYPTWPAICPLTPNPVFSTIFHIHMPYVLPIKCFFWESQKNLLCFAIQR